MNGTWSPAVTQVDPYGPLFAVDGQLFALDGGLWRLGFGIEWPDPTLGEWEEFSDVAVADQHLLLYDDLTNGLWATDGTAVGAYPLQYLADPNPLRSDRFDTDAHWFTHAGEQIFFTANVGGVGRELWAVPVAALPEICIEDCPGGPTPTETPTLPPSPTAAPATPSPTPAPATATPDCGDDCTAVTVDDVTGAPGESVSVAAHLTARREPVAGVELSLGFQPAAPVAADERGRPDCQVNPAIDKGASAFVFMPIGCQSTGRCTAVHALVLSLDSVAPIADGAELFTCVLPLRAA